MIRELRAADPHSIGRYRLLGRLGSGGMGMVYLGRSPGGRLVAIKVIRPELADERGFRSRFASEIAVARNVSGIYTAAVVDADPEAELPWLATAYVPGPSLGDAVDDEGPLPVRSVLSLAGGLAEALQAIHAAGVVHRDLKPSNVLLAADGPRVIDFGISRAWERSRLTGTGVVMGSPGFLSPEQAVGSEVGAPSDVFSLGAVLAFAATGDSPFGTGPMMALLYRVVNQAPDLSQVPARLRPVIEPCLAKDPASRPSPAGLLAMLSAETGLLTGEWLPKTVTDTLHRYIPTVATPAPASQELPARGAPIPVIAPEPLSAAAMPDASSAADVAADVTHDIHVPGGATAPADPGSSISAPDVVPVATIRRLRRRWPLAGGVAAAVAVGVLAAVFATSLGGPPGAGPTATPSLPHATPSTATTLGKPIYGGTLHIVADTGPDHVDTVPAYYTADYELERAYTRQLVSYPSVPALSTSGLAWQQDTTPVADVATEVPTVANGGITDGGMVYTFHIKPKVDWDTTPARQVTAEDFIREFKAFFNPVSPVGNPGYYTSTIAGLQAYDNAETAFFSDPNKEPPTAANIANFQNTHNISGIKAINALTLQFTLIQPTSDFLYMLAMPFASARPVEYDSYVPDSQQLDEHTISDGPYQISSYVPGKSITFVRNPAWNQSTDPLRHQYVNQIVLTEGVASAQAQLSDIRAGTEDLPNDTAVNPASIPQLAASHASNFQIWPWPDMFPYIVFNLRSPDAGGAMQKVLVRQAIEYGLDKVAVLKAYGGSYVGQVINTVIPPGNVGYQNYNLYPDNNGAGNVTTCKADLAKAGYPNGLTLTYMYPNDAVDTSAFEAVQASLAQCGITLTGKGEPGSTFFVDLGNAPENDKPNAWDMGQTGWIPDWYGNNGRTVIQALFQGPNCIINTINYGCYENASVNADIASAEAATSLSAAGADWHAADVQIMKDAAIVPIMSQTFPMIASARVRGVLPNGDSYPTAIFNPNIGDPDITNVWLAGS